MVNFLLEGEHHLFTLIANEMSTLSTGCLRCRHEKHYVPVWTPVYTATSSTETYLICDDKIQIGASKLFSVTETAVKSPFLCVNNTMRYGFRSSARPMRGIVWT